MLPLASFSMLLFFVSLGVCQPALAQQFVKPEVATSTGLSGEEVVRKMVLRNGERAKELSAIQGTRIYRLEYRGFPGSRSAEMVVDVKYHSPATEEFTIRTATGSNFLIERVLKKLLQSETEAFTAENRSRVALNKENYIFTLIGKEDTQYRSFYILSVEPRTDYKLLYRGRIWVDAEDFAVARIEAALAENCSPWMKDVKIEHTYAKVADFWLPTSNRSTSNTRLGGSAVLTIEYRNYLVTPAPIDSDSPVKVAGRF